MNIFRYDWHLDLSYYHNYTNCTNIDKYESSHIPMVWGWRPGQEAPDIPKSASFILGFNEPNMFDQSNMTARDAAKYWRVLEDAAQGVSLVSPAAAPCGSKTSCHGNALEWFDEFFKECDGCRVDYLATHAYMCDADKTMAYLAKLYDRYGLEIWLTEFACPHHRSALEQLEYMAEILPRLEASPYIFRYSWYQTRIIDSRHVFVTSSASLLERNTSTLTELGQFYVNFHRETKGTITTIPTTGVITAFAIIAIVVGVAVNVLVG